MIYLEVANLEEWAEEKGVTIEIMQCCGCGKEFETTVPYVTRESYGLDMPPHGCPQRKHRVSEIPKNRKLADSRILDRFEYFGVNWYDVRKCEPTPIQREANSDFDWI